MSQLEIGYLLLTNFPHAVGMMRIFLPLLLLVAACNTPSLHFAGLPATRIAVGNSVFDVRIKGKLAEAIRVNTYYVPRADPVLKEATLAITLVGRCEVTGVLGDQAVVTGVLDCASETQVIQSPADYGCQAVDPTALGGTGPPGSAWRCP